MTLLSVVGFDPSLTNWGIATGTYDVYTDRLKVHDLSVISPERPDDKKLSMNLKDLFSATELAAAAIEACQNAHYVFVEMPIGSQSARAMVSYGLCIGVIGTLKAMGKTVVTVTPNQVKKAITQDKLATKTMMINAAMYKHPEAPWPMRRFKDLSAKVIAGRAEHMADAIGAIYAGIPKII